MLKEYVSKQIVSSIGYIILAFFGFWTIFFFLDINLGISPFRDIILIEYADDLEGVDLFSQMERASAWLNCYFYLLASLLASIASYWLSPRGKEVWCAVIAIIVGLSILHAIDLAALSSISTVEIIRDFLCIMIAVVTSTLVRRLRQSRWDMPET
jgi:hypothetical protein